MIYVPKNAAIEVYSLGAQAAYRAEYFDPVTGKRTALGEVRADAGGDVSATQGCDHDWVVVMEPAK